MEREAVAGWVASYERAWRTAGTQPLGDLFTPDATYLRSPWAQPICGLDELARFWEQERDGPDEAFDLGFDVVAVDADIAVVRVEVEYHGTDTTRWRDLWVMRFGPDGRCQAFEEWPFAPGQPDGH